MADFNQPTNTSLRTVILEWLRNLAHSSATWLDTRRTTDTNIPTYAKRWNNSTKLIEDYNGSSWNVLQIESAGVVASTTSKRGVIQLATNTEVTTGTNSDKAVVPSSLKVELDKKALLAGNSNQVFSAANATDNVHVINRQTGDARYAALGGSATQRFKVAAAVNADEAVRKIDLDAHTEASAPHTGHPPTTLTITAGNGLTGGGSLAASRTLTLGTPGTLTAATINAVTATSHTHLISEASQAQAEAGSDNTVLMTPLRTRQAIDARYGAKTYKSPPQEITSGGTLTLAHGLGVLPRTVTTYLQCVTAQYDYSIGDIISNLQGADANHANCVVLPTSTSLIVRFGSSITVFRALHKTGGQLVSLTNANWRLIVVASI